MNQNAKSAMYRNAADRIALAQSHVADVLVTLRINGHGPDAIACCGICSELEAVGKRLDWVRRNAGYDAAHALAEFDHQAAAVGRLCGHLAVVR